jgi:hypothetical protein
MIRTSVGLVSVLVLLAITSRVEAQQYFSQPQVVQSQGTRHLPSQTPNTNLEAYRVNSHVYVVPFRRPAVIPVPMYAPYYQTYRPRWYYPAYGRGVRTRSSSRSTTGGSHYFGPPHASQYFGNPHGSHTFGR